MYLENTLQFDLRDFLETFTQDTKVQKIFFCTSTLLTHRVTSFPQLTNKWDGVEGQGGAISTPEQVIRIGPVFNTKLAKTRWFANTNFPARKQQNSNVIFTLKLLSTTQPWKIIF